MGEFSQIWRDMDSPAPEQDNDTAKININLRQDIQPDAAAAQLDLSQQTGLPIDTVRNRQGEVEKQVEVSRYDAGRMTKETPSLARVMADRAKAPIAKPDVMNMRLYERLYRDVGQSAESGTIANDYGDIGMKRMISGDESLSGEELLRLGRIKRRDLVDYKLPLVAKIPGAITEQGALYTGFAKDTSGTILGATAAGAGAGGAAGFLAGNATGIGLILPEEIVTVPGGAIYGAKKALQFTLPKALFLQGFNAETGSAFNDYVDTLDENGKPIERDVAMGAAVITGSVNSILEYAGGKFILEKFPGMDKVFGKLGKETVTELVKTPSGREAMKRIAGAFTSSALVEGGTEGIQELVSVVMGEAQKLVSNGEFNNIFGDVTVTENGVEKQVPFINYAGDQIAYAAERGALGGGGLAGIGAGVNIGAQAVGANMQQKRDQKVIEERKQAVRQMELSKRSPQVLKEFLKDLPQEDYYISAEKAKTFFQSDEQRNEFFRLVPEARDQFEEALAAGGDLVIPSSSIDGMFAETDQFDGLQEFMKREPAALTDEELKRIMDEEVMPAIANYDPSTATEGEAIQDRISTEIMNLNNPRINSPENAMLYGSLFRSTVEAYKSRFGDSTALHSTLNDMIDKISVRDGDQVVADAAPVDPTDILLNRIRAGSAVKDKGAGYYYLATPLTGNPRTVQVVDNKIRDGKQVIDISKLRENNLSPEQAIAEKLSSDPKGVNSLYSGDQRPASMLDFIREKGGIDPNDANIGDIKITDIDLTNVKRKDGKGNYKKKKGEQIIREGGMNLDDLGEALSEAGYFPELGGERPTVNDVINAIDAEVRGNPRYANGIEGDTRSSQQAAEEENMIRFLDELGIDPNKSSNAEIKRAMALYDGNIMPEGIASNIISEFEGYRAKPYWDVNAYRAGFGSDTTTLEDGTVVPITPDMVVTRADSERDLQRRTQEFMAQAEKDIGAEWDQLSPAQQAVMTSLAYNYGSVPDRVTSVINNGGDVEQAIRDLGGDNDGVNNERRNREADLWAKGYDGAPAKVTQAAVDLSPEQDIPFEPAAPVEPATVQEPESFTAPDTPLEKIVDVGEKLEGARKDEWQKYNTAIKSELPSDVSEITLSKHFPEPNYENLIQSGADVRVLAAIKAMRDEIPAKPRKAWRLKQWGESVKLFREFTNDMLDGKISYEKFIEKGKAVRGLNTFFKRAELYAEVGYPAFKNAGGYEISEGMYSIAGGKEFSTPKKMWSVSKGREFGQQFDTREQAVEYLKAKLATAPETGERKTKLDIYQVTKTGEIIVGKKVGSGKFIDLKKGFTSVKEARQFLNENYEQLLAELEKQKDVPFERRSTNDPRKGEDYRLGEDTPAEKFAAEFGFRGVQFGNYVEQKKRAADLNNAYDALHDMANLLGIPAKAISLNGKLGIAFGARGKGGKGAAAAHYESDTTVINLTKNSGAGSLAHEWFHAFDNYFGIKQEGGSFLTKMPRLRKVDKSGKPITVDPIRPQVVEAFKGVMDAIKASGLTKRSEILDSRKTKDYWATDHELSARAFEAYIIEKAKQKGDVNDYLANILSEGAWDALDKGTYPYPTADEMSGIVKAFDNLFNIVETRGTDKGVEFFQKNRGSATFMPDGATIIKVFKDGNMSTILHETGHVFLEMQRALAEHPEAPQSIKDDWAKTLEWLGVKSGAEIGVDQHEKFARGFEAYLYEGNAPSLELRGAFQRFKAWLVKIYKDIRNLDVKLNEDIRGVFDRMLATDEQIEQVKQNPMYQPNTELSTILTKAEYDAYVAQYNRAMEAAKEQLLKKALRQMQRKDKEWWKAETAKLREEIGAVINSQPIHRAVNYLRTGKDLVDNSPIQLEHKRLSKKIIRDLYDAGYLPEMPKGTVAPSGGVHPQIIADLFGFKDVDAMLMQMANYTERKEIIDTSVEREMINRHGDMLYDGTMEREAQEQAEGAIREKILATELNAISRKTQNRAATQDAFKAQAKKIIDSVPINKVRPNDYYRTEVRAAREAGKWLKAKNYEKAADAKSREMLNHFLYKEATEARKMRDKLEKYASKFSKDAVRSKIEKADRDQIDVLLKKFGLSTSGKLQETDVSFSDYAAEKQSQGEVVYTPEIALGKGSDYRSLSVENVRDIFDTIKNIDALGREQRDILVGTEKLTAAEAMQKAVDSIYANNKIINRSDKTGGSLSNLRKGVDSLIGNITRVEYIAKELDGGKVNGAVAQAIINPLRKAGKDGYEMLADLNNQLTKILEANPDAKKWGNKKTYKLEDGRELKLTRGNLIMIALNMGNEGNMKNLTSELGHKFTEADIEMFKAELTEADWASVQKIWDMFEGIRPKVEETYRVMSNLDMKVVPAVPVQTPYGELRGGYVPIVYDPEGSFQGTRNAESVAVNEDNFSIPSVGKGFTKTRSKNFAAEISLDFNNVIQKHIHETAHFVTHAQAVRQVNRIISRTEFRKAVIDTFGTNTLSEIRPWLQAVARNTVYDSPVIGIDKLMRHLRVGTSTIYLGLGLGTGVKQTLGLTSTEAAVSRGDVKQKHFLRALRDMATKPVEASEFAFANSNMMAERLKGIDADSSVVLRGDWTKGKISMAQKVGFMPLVYTQVFTVDVPTWNAGYLEGLDRHEGNHQQAVNYADALLSQTQGSGNVMDLARIQRGNEFQKAAASMFGTYFIGVLTPMLRQNFRDAAVRKNVYRAALTILPLIVLPAVMEGYLSNDAPDDDESLGEWVLLKSALYGLPAVPLVGGFVGSLAGDFDYRLSPVEGPLNTIRYGIKDAADGDLGKAAVKGGVVAFGLATKLPVYNPYKMIDEIMEVSRGDDEFSFREVFLGAMDDERK